MDAGDARFIADSMLGRLATWLRILGYDTLYFRDAQDGRLVALARREGRILLTRDTRLLMRRRLCPMLFVRHDRVWEQLRQVAGELGLSMGPRLGGRGLRCTSSLAPPAKARGGGRPGRLGRDAPHAHGGDGAGPMRVIFMGTPAFAVSSLTRLLQAGHEVMLVVTQPDRPAGRGAVPRTPAVKRAAEAAGLSVIQPVKIRDAEVAGRLRRGRPEVLGGVAFGQLLPRASLDIPPQGCP